MSPISVVLTYYNETSYVREALASLASQTYPEIEVIVVDDGAEVPFASLVETQGLTLVRQENAGDTAARNAGVRQASHELIAFIDADDLWPENRLALLASAMEDSPGAVLAYGMVEQFVSPELSDSVKAGLDCPAEPLSGYLPTGMLMRKHLFDQIGMFPEDRSLHGSLEWVARLRAAGLPETRVEHVVLHRRLHETNMSREVDRKNARMLRSLRQRIRQSRGDS
jgi:glycosyltransferase involved in cell wall biosynthesis